MTIIMQAALTGALEVTIGHLIDDILPFDP